MRLGPIEHLEPRTQVTIRTFSGILISSLCASASLFPPSAPSWSFCFSICLPITSEFTHPQFQPPYEKLPCLSSRFNMPGKDYDWPGLDKVPLPEPVMCGQGGSHCTNIEDPTANLWKSWGWVVLLGRQYSRCSKEQERQSIRENLDSSLPKSNSLCRGKLLPKLTKN